MVLGVPWNTQDKDPKADGEPLVVVWPERVGEQEADRADSEKAVPRRPQLNKADFDKHGWTQGCPGCKAALLGKPAQGHTDACRRRMEENLKHDPKVQKANKRIDEFLAKTLEKQDRKKAKQDAKTNGDKSAPSSSDAPGQEKKRTGDGTDGNDNTLKAQKVSSSSSGPEVPQMKREGVDGSSSNEPHTKSMRKTFSQGEERKRAGNEAGNFRATGDIPDEDPVDQARRIQREKRKDGPQGDRDASMDEPEPKRADPHALVLLTESNEQSASAISIGSLNTFDTNDEAEGIQWRKFSMRKLGKI